MSAHGRRPRRKPSVRAVHPTACAEAFVDLVRSVWVEETNPLSLNRVESRSSTLSFSLNRVKSRPVAASISLNRVEFKSPATFFSLNRVESKSPATFCSLNRVESQSPAVTCSLSRYEIGQATAESGLRAGDDAALVPADSGSVPVSLSRTRSGDLRNLAHVPFDRYIRYW